MAGRDRTRGPDLDDWFAEPGRTRPDRDVAGEDDWLERPPGPARPRLDMSNRQTVLVVGAFAVALLLIGLAVAGVFSGGSTHRPPTPTTTQQQTTPTVPTTTPAPTVRPPTTTLKPGDSGAQVRALQRTLAALGYSPGRADGSYGPSTQRAVEAFQRASGLTVDGIVGSKTLAALTQAAANRG